MKALKSTNQRDVGVTLPRVTEKIWRNGQTLVRRVAAGNFTAMTSLLMPSSRVRASDPARLKYWWDYFELRNGITKASKAQSGDLRIMDLFCGCGAFALGISRAARAVGLNPKIALAADIDPDALHVYSQNLDVERKLQENLWSLVEFHLRREGDGHAEFAREPMLLHPALRALVGKIDVVIGGPPCQGHSNSNNSTRRNDPRNLLYLVPLVVAASTGANVVIIENVPGVIHDRYAQVASLARKLAASLGYYVDDMVINALELGLPQTRRRHLLICSRNGTPDISAAVRAVRTEGRSVEFAIRDLVDAEGSSILDEAATLSKENQRRIEYLFKHGLLDLPTKVRPNCHKNGTTYTSVYGKLSWHLPAGTITTGFMTPGRGRFVHPQLGRALTPHEAARLQGIPDGFRFEIEGQKGKKKALSKLIGDAVPPQMGYVAGLAALATMKSL